MTQRNSGPVVRGLERSSEGRAAKDAKDARDMLIASRDQFFAPPFLRLPANHTQPCQPGALQIGIAASLCGTRSAKSWKSPLKDIQCLGITPKEQMEPGPKGAVRLMISEKGPEKIVGCIVDILWMFYVFPTLECLKLKLDNWTTFRIFPLRSLSKRRARFGCCT